MEKDYISFELSDLNKNYVFDTCALNNSLAINKSDVNTLIASRKKGFNYFWSPVQWREIEGYQDRKNKYNEPRPIIKRKDGIYDVIFKLQMERISVLATLLPNYMTTDGIRRVASSDLSDPIVIMFNDIHRNNKNYLLDALIAESTLRNNYILVTEDKRLLKIIKQHFPNNVVHYNDFIFSMDKIINTTNKNL